MALPAWVWPVLDLWLLCRRFGGPLTPPPLPVAGAPGEQPAALMDGFAILDELVAEKETGGDR